MDIPAPSRWLTEPAKLVGWTVAAVIATAAVTAEVLNETVDLLPHSWQPTVRGAAAGVLVVGGIATRVQAVLTRNGAIGKVSVGGQDFTGVFAPYTVMADPTLPALPGTQPGPTPQGQ